MIVVIILLILNLAVALVYLAWGLLSPKAAVGEDGKRDRRKYFLSALVMVLCPIAGPVFLLLSTVFFKVLFRKEVDLADVVFSKDKVQAMDRGDDDRERNIVPLEEALAISDSQSLRTLMLNILRGDISESLAAIAEALNSSDTEAAHYAASVLRDELNDFRANVQRLYDEVKEGLGGVSRRSEDDWDLLEDDEEEETAEKEGGEGAPEDEEEITDGAEKAMESARTLIRYMNAFLVQGVFTDMEQEEYVNMMADVASMLGAFSGDEMTPEYYEWVAMRFLEVKDYTSCEEWCKKSLLQYPRELSSFTNQLKLYFEMGNKDKFFEVMKQLKASPVVIDKETLELIRTFG